MSNLKEEFISRENIYDGVILKAVKDTVRLPDGKEGVREFCMHVGAVAVIPILPDGRVIMERQYRYPHGRVFFEIPAGKLNFKGEDALSAAARELREETGAVASKYTSLGKLVPSPAIIDEAIEIYLAEEVTFVDRELDEDEFIDLEYVHIDDLYRMVMDGDIEDAKTQIAVLKAYVLKKRSDKP